MCKYTGIETPRTVRWRLWTRRELPVHHVLYANVQLCVCRQCDMQKLTVEELKRLLYDTFCDHLSMKDIENIIMTEENHIENPEDCQLDIDSKEAFPLLCGLSARMCIIDSDNWE